jgi:hypothetical protein
MRLSVHEFEYGVHYHLTQGVGMSTVSYAAPGCIVSYSYPLKYVPLPIVLGGVTSGGRGSDIGGGGDNTGGRWMVQNDHWH